MSRFPGIERTYSSIDTTLTPEEVVLFPIEFLNYLDISGMQPHILTLKIGCPVIVLRSLHPPHITNGTRCIIAVLHTNVVEVKILHGPSAGKPYFIPRIPLIPSDSDLPFQFRRLQFPTRPCFAMTINKSQGQTFKHIGIDLSTPVVHTACYTLPCHVSVARTDCESTHQLLPRETLCTRKCCEDVVNSWCCDRLYVCPHACLVRLIG